jgi:hypothetical protein
MVHELRNFRDQEILKTRTGAAFMALFNSWYYSFSPHITTYLRTDSTQRTIVRIGLYPLIGVLYASYYTYFFLSQINSEVATVAAGIVAAGLVGLIYLATPVFLITSIFRRRLKTFPHVSLIGTWTTFALGAVGISYWSGATLLEGLAAAQLVLLALVLGCVFGIKMLERIEFQSKDVL